MNYLFFGKSSDLNIGNGKTVSAVNLVFKEHILYNKSIWSNIKLFGIPYKELRPDNIDEVLEDEDCIVLIDELYAIIDINHKVSPSCKKHEYPGACYEIAKLYRQVRKRNITTAATCQSYSDCIYRLKVVMQNNILCSKYDISTGRYKKCQMDNCQDSHIHRIKQENIRTGITEYMDPSVIYGMYDSSEIVKGWEIE